MDDVIKALKQIVSAISEYRSVPKPVTVCVSLFSSIFGFYLIFFYFNLSRQQTIWLAVALGIMVLVTGGYFLFKRGAPPETGFDEAQSASPSVPPETRSAGLVRRDAGGTDHFWDTPPRPRAQLPSAPRPAAPVSVAAQASPARRSTVTLLELTEPLFQYVCRLNRIGRRGKSGETTTFLTKAAAVAASPPAQASSAAKARAAGLDEVIVRSEIKALLEDILNKASADLHLSRQAQLVEMPLIFFVDSMISESALPFAAQWNQNRLAYERQELAGDEKFYDLLDETMKDSGEDAAERLAIYYICIGLGFTGIYFKQPELLRKTMLGIAPRIRHMVENDQTARICPEAYQGIDTRNLVEPPSRRMVLVGLVFACFTLAVLISYVMMYREASRNLNFSIEDVLRRDLAVQQPN